jgi:ABC-type multidrug transport system permease subunit
MNRSVLVFIIMAAAIVTLSGCFPGGTMYNDQEPAGFFSGVWHGWIAPISLIVGFFKSDIRIYEPTNTGWWYDLGFYIAVISGFGSVAFFRRKEKKGKG